ncbi:hypothetical protein [Dyadobacter luticola]|uniref:hypothetical protein n=1 Tax=Dyadobacter luticola TaxID=1979387 RepID=UPI00148631BF|nr:hypothetical protein [Dyadobacter luticola]
MPAISKKSVNKGETKHPLDRKFKTVEEASQAKTDYLVNVVMKDYDFNKPIR